MMQEHLVRAFECFLPYMYAVCVYSRVNSEIPTTFDDKKNVPKTSKVRELANHGLTNNYVFRVVSDCGSSAFKSRYVMTQNQTIQSRS